MRNRLPNPFPGNFGWSITGAGRARQ
ncbi:hypothetical protein Golax_009905 [Gossypium laxum]|uniref:Uncharacterized protein n=1 Tax=Gossypium laxum TaxID=34288 RepID=A0A7J8ZFP7_9ROSI|nr:hypothetical protein [Gossypium laxum]